MLAAIEFVEDRDARRFFDPARKVGPAVAAALLARGVIARAMPQGDILGFAPPLCLTRDEADTIVARGRGGGVRGARLELRSGRELGDDLCAAGRSEARAAMIVQRNSKSASCLVVRGSTCLAISRRALGAAHRRRATSCVDPSRST